MSAERSARIATHNDRFRAACGLPVAPPVPGRYLMTSGVAALSVRFQLAALAKVRSFDVFDEDNDPYGEHDFGVVELDGVRDKLFWKIDYFADATMTYGAEDPSDAQSSYRVLTVLLANEY
ncbi:MAG: DUF3768 domain-containing protein [Acidobacteria bacterium]|nr:DUF3768 domain-containing protein [Acidobacteriota bacterium]